ncbi:energy-coupling factor transport system ATP-binding protein [Salirhabdus euzebyi]|uniref:Energy-coupling factor transport system ATP-binding protein n=1 Tax=Salirhabdus euzebyi TaxID=394506 RepID=A0A841Q8J5_9BACI|nr:ABC transporter ATP-binding protein [Salirhabdus euzebyi]MBB6454939.1 energy-coupling factor transport system ATP-binding protein [Salirhabdus euzebyi]
MKKPIIQFENFGFKYRSQAQPTLHDINLTIYEGEKVLIVGPSGSGKSTLAHCINGLIPHSYKGEKTGSLKMNGQEVYNQSIFERSKMVGTVLQDPDSQFIGITVAEDIAFSLENDCTPQDEMVNRVSQVAKLVEMDEFLSASIHHLSGGQKQRVSLGGVMVDNVDILLFDEPLANLDPATGKHAIDLIDDIQKETNKTIVIIEHRLEDVLHSKVDRIIVVNEGKIVCDAIPNELLSSTVLEENNLREPLYVKALKYAGCEVTPEIEPEHIHKVKVENCKDKLQSWFEAINAKKHSSNEPIALELQNISFGYDSDKQILHNISFSIQKGEMISIVGKNGAGKSTLSKLICGFERPSTGKILLNGRDITDDSIKERAEKIGIVMQNPNHMISKHLIFDEVAFGLKVRGIPEKEIEERVEKTLKICGLYPFRKWPINALSFGQKKRVTIASVLVMNPEVLILDEPTAGQDFRHYTEIMEFLVELNKLGVTIMMITHDMHLMLEYTPRGIAISNGEKIADDTAANLLTDERVIKKANLKETSLFELALRSGISQPREFVQQFIHYDREVRHRWQ